MTVDASYPTVIIDAVTCETVSRKRQQLLIFGISYYQTGTCMDKNVVFYLVQLTLIFVYRTIRV
jgi:hypothetical protein